MMTIDHLLQAATAEHRAGNRPQARHLYQQALHHTPDHPTAQFRLGLLEYQEGRFHEALVLISRAVGSSPQDANFQFGLGEVLTAMKHWDQAAAAYRLVPPGHPQFAQANFGIGVALQSNLDCPGAVIAYQTALKIQPDHAASLSNLGTILQAQGRADEALQLLHAATALEPDVPSHAINLGAVFCQQRQFAEAESVLKTLLARDKTNVPATYNLGNALHGLGRLIEAAELFRRAILLCPYHADAMLNLGNVCKEQGDFKQAADAYESALRVQPALVSAINNSACLLRTTGRLEEAETTLRRGLAIHPHHATLHDTLGNVLKDAGRLDQAIDCFRTAITLDPAASITHSNLIYSLSFCSDGPTILQECRRWNDRHARSLQSQVSTHASDRSPDRRLRIGYVSPDFRDHCQSLFTTPLLSHHDHAAFEIFCYSSVERPDDHTCRIKSFADVWRDVRTLDDQTLADLIRADRIDILIDLTMHMADGRPLLFARKPARIQIAWLAYPGTTGLPTMDYRFSDPRLDPEGFENHYTEQTIHLPDSFWCYDPLTDQPQVNELPALSQGHITLGCLNNPCKLTDHTLALWAGVMQALPDSRLLLMAPPGSYRQLLLDRLAAHAVTNDRIDFVSYRPRAQYLQTYHQIDLGLDTFPYNGHTTSLDSFWMGVPVISRVGQTCVGRGGLSQLFQLGLSELATDNNEEFIAVAVNLANELPRLSQLRQQLRGRLTQSPLMNAQRFARNIETAYRQAWDNYCRKN